MHRSILEAHAPKTRGLDGQLAQSAVDALSAHIAILDDSGRIIAVNKAWTDFAVANSGAKDRCGLGVNYLEICERAVSSDNPTDDGQPDARIVYNGIRAVIRGETKEVSVDYPCHSPTERRWFKSRVTRFTADGPVRVVISHEDITALKLVEEQLGVAKEAAESSARAKSEFLANMSHEIRTPVAAVIGFAEMMLDPDPMTPAGFDGPGTILRNARHLLGVINGILDLSKIEAGRMSVETVRTDLPRLLAEVMEIMRPRAQEKGIGFGLEFTGVVPRFVTTDPTRLKDILLNLVGNAIKFTSRGRVKVRVGCEPAARSLCFEVYDTGIGITAAELSKLFRPFAQADGSTTRRFGGTGLGLQISRSLARLMGGDISVTSTAGVGSVFTARIAAGWDQSGPPCRLEDAVVRRLLETATEPGTLTGRILLAEDGPDNRVFLLAILRRAGLEVVVAENGRQAVERALSGRFDLILMDMQMPELDGYDATRELRRLGFNRPVIALTAHALSTDRGRCIDCGCNDYVTKPVDRKTLIETVGRYLNRPVPTEAGPIGAAEIPQISEEIFSTLERDPVMAEIVPKFVAALPARVASMKSLADRTALTDLRLIVHHLKGAGGSYGFDRLTAAAAAAEAVIDAGQSLEEVKKGVDALVDLIRRVHGYDRAGEAVGPV